ncbi:bifunctional folylpolyglutamate synthase/dihydrofolate synthase [Thermoproteota archaeon]
MEYREAIDFLDSFLNYENILKYSYRRSFSLNRIREFLKRIGNPHHSLRVIHVAGSKGKGSVSAFITYILKEEGFKIGLYTSPHLCDFRERIRILSKDSKLETGDVTFEGMISKQDLCSAVTFLRPYLKEFSTVFKKSPLTFFEVYTALALHYFKSKKVDFVVLETGLGGRLDATNVCSSLLSIITPISYEHTMRLGKSLKKIAYEKACIIKKQNAKTQEGRRVVLTSRQNKSVMTIIEKMADRHNAILLKAGRDFTYLPQKNGSFHWRGFRSRSNNLKIGLLGSHQIANASLAIAASRALRYYNIKVGKGAIREGLRCCVWPARFEIISRQPLIIIDGAQNLASAVALRSTLRRNFPGRKAWVIFGISQDKEIRDTSKAIAKISSDIILAKADSPRASEPINLKRYFSDSRVVLTNSISQALHLVKSRIHASDIILVTGSLYLCGEARKIVVEEENKK